MAIWITSIATGVIAIYAFMSYRLGSEIQKRDKEHQQQISDLYQAISITNLLSGPVQVGSIEMADKIKAFKSHYKGKIPIFN
jgi:hypothetical protein